MRPIKYVTVLLTCLVLFAGCSKQYSQSTILINGKIFTSRDEGQFVSALAISKGMISASGNDEEVLAHKTKNTRIIDLRGKTVIPGFHDAHLHFWSGAYLAVQVNLIGSKSKSEALQKIAEAAALQKAGEWIIGRGWDHELWEGKKLPGHDDLDELTSEHFVYLKRIDGHAAWVNQKVLDLLNYNQTTPDPLGGKILKDAKTGKPTGILVDTAYDTLDNILSLPSSEVRNRILQQAIRYSNSLGITSVTDNSDAQIFENYAQLFKQDDLTLRVNFWIYGDQNLDSLANRFNEFSVDHKFLNSRLTKFFVDGSMGSRSAYLHQPYRDDPTNVGLPQHSRETLLTQLRIAYKGNWYIGVHAIGDAGNSMVLDLYEELIEDKPDSENRLRIEHAQFVQPGDIERFVKLEIIASMQPTHCISDMKWVENRIGDRAQYTYSWRSMLGHGIPLAFGTDWPVEPLDPLIGIYAAVTRQDTLGNPEGGWYPEQCLTVGEAVYAYTAGSAYAVGAESWLGRLLPGYAADLVILDRDIFSIPPAEILKTRVLATYLAGKEVFNSERLK
ncbi:MAG: amidohydrolase family protein [Calditrichae bacterium]|nr:amidohydrolase family protein [Calditrichia bacterium]